jgi:DNA-binding CsgD family transcriptional regulator
MIVGRDAELRLLDGIAPRLAQGAGQTLVIHGEAGIGKTTLLDHLAGRCTEPIVVLRAAGAETEAELAFAALGDLLSPIIDGLASLPAAQKAALAGALALGPPAPGERLAVCVATLGLLRARARRGPVLVLVDDLQWVDASSRQCLEFVARRAGAAIAVVVAARDPWRPPEGAWTQQLVLGPVDETSATELLRRHAPALAPPVAAVIAEAAAGNPLALVELPATLTPGQQAGIDALPLPLAPGDRLRQALAQRIEALDASTRTALLVAALDDSGDPAAIAAACGLVGTAIERLVQPEAKGLLKLHRSRVIFTHPLIRGAVSAGATAAERRVAHGALAEAVDGDRRVWHRAAAAFGPDETVAAELERVGGSAAARRAFASASAAYERAAALTGDRTVASRCLLAAGQAAGAAGSPDRAVSLLGDAANVTLDHEQHARAQHARGRIMAWSGSQRDATALLVEEAEHVAGSNPVLAATMLADAANACTHVNEYLTAEALVQRAAGLLGERGEPVERAPVLALLGWIRVLRGRAPQGRPLLQQAEQLARDLDPLGPHWPWQHLLLRALIPLEELERAVTTGHDLCERARDGGALTILGGALLVSADAAFRLGDWRQADVLSREAIQVAGDAGQAAWLGFALSTHARLTAAQGLSGECREAMREARQLAEGAAITSGLRFVHGTLGFLALTLDDVEGAITHLAPIERILAGTGLEEPTLVPWAPDLVEAYARAGETRDARRVLRTLERQAATSGSSFAAAAAARCRGTLDARYEPAFARALRAHNRRPMPFERARTLLAYGRRLHRANRRAAARERLREAELIFDELGAAGWAAQAQRELRAAGARRRRASRDALTAQEKRVVEIVCTGASNREVATQLFLSPKTIEFHLRQVYRKLSVHSRTELMVTVAELESRGSPGGLVGPGSGSPS